MKHSIAILFAIVPAVLQTACGGGGSAVVQSSQQIVTPPPTVGAGAGWKMNWGDGPKSIQIYGPRLDAKGKPILPVEYVVAEEITWNVSATFGPLTKDEIDAGTVRAMQLAEPATSTLVIDEGPNKGKTTPLQWKGTTIPYDISYHPLTSALCQSTTNPKQWGGFGSTGDYAVYEDANGEGRIVQGHFWSEAGRTTVVGAVPTGLPGSNVVSQHAVNGALMNPGLVAQCGDSPVWYTVYYDRGGKGPGTLAF